MSLGNDNNFRPDLPKPFLSVTRLTNQTINNSTLTTVIFDTILYQYRIDYNTITGIVTIQDDGIYNICYNFVWGTNNTTGVRTYRIHINGIEEKFDYMMAVDAFNDRPFIRSYSPTYLYNGDTIEIKVSQNRGGTLDIAALSRSPELSIAKVSDFNG